MLENIQATNENPWQLVGARGNNEKEITPARGFPDNRRKLHEDSLTEKNVVVKGLDKKHQQ